MGDAMRVDSDVSAMQPDSSIGLESEHQSAPGLQLEERPRLQRFDWLAQRIGWSVFGLLLVGALCGFFGSGPVSNRTLAMDGGSVSYSRFARIGTATSLNVQFVPAVTPGGPGPAPGGATRSFWIDQEYLRGMEIRTVTPAPERQELLQDRVIFTFRVSDPGPAATVMIRMEPLECGPVRARIGIDDHPGLELVQYVYP
jgi:hypothetical protein